MDGHASVVIMSKLAAFAEVLFGHDAETTQIVRGGDDHFDNYSCEIYTRHHCFELQSAGGHVRLFAASLDSLADSTMLAEVQAIDPHALSTLRTVLATTEALAEMRDQKNTAGMVMLRHMVDDALAAHDRAAHRRRWI
jgi:hypothetical protein